MTYLIQIDDEIREATDDEAKRILDVQAEAEKRIADAQAKATAKAALLERLGISADEAALLVQ